MTDPARVTRLLESAREGDRKAAAELLPIVYDRLRRLAQARMAAEPAGLTLQPTALVHEAYLRLVGEEDPGWDSRAHFFAAAAEAMRRILIERARRMARVKHGGHLRRVSTTVLVAGPIAVSEELLAVDEALDRLERQDPDMAAVVKLRYFAGLTMEETGRCLGVSVRTADRRWEAARAWMQREMASR